MMRAAGTPRTVRVALLLSAALLYGCGGTGDYADLRAFMEDAKARPAGPVEPLPSFEQMPPFAYQASTMRGPFDPPVVVKKVERASGGAKVQPDLNRVKQFLEQFPIATLAMVGTLAQGDRLYALVRDGEGGVHRGQLGDYMGTDYGRIQKIAESELELIEIVPDGTGGWVERARTVALGETNRG